MYAETVKKRRPGPGPGPDTRERVERELAWAAGTEQFRHRDPLYHVTEGFQQLFDDVGRRHASALEAEGGFGFSAEERRGAQAPARAQTERYEGRPLVKFAETAFQRGRLSAAVLQGTGKLMQTSCLKRTVGQSGPKKLQQQTVLGIGSQTRNVPGHDPDKMVFNRGFVNSAIGLVADTLRDARRTVDALSDMAAGTGELDGRGSGTLREMYPFLDDSRERELEAAYRMQLAESGDGRERAVLHSALIRTQALIAKKAQMKNEFINKLRLISDRAAEALAELEAPGTAEEIAAAVLTAPEDPEGEDEPNADDRRGPEERSGHPQDGDGSRPGTGT